MDKNNVIKTFSGSSFKVYHVIREMTVTRFRNDPTFDGWVEVSHNQLKNKTGVQSIFRVIDEFKSHPEIVEVQVVKGVSNRYRINKGLL